MAKKVKNAKGTDGQTKGNPSEKKSLHGKTAAGRSAVNEDLYLVRMNGAPTLGETSHWFQMLPIIFFTTIIIMIVRLASYTRPLDQFYFYAGSENNSVTDFFSYYKMIAIVVCASLVLLILLYKAYSQGFFIKATYAYAPMLFYIVFVLLSYVFSDYKVFALWGWVDRLEGTVTLIAYMVMLFYTINFVNSEKNVKQIVSFLVGISTILGLLGVTQASNHDFFRTVLGKKLITPPSFWPHVDSLNFTFTDEIYQTVYNINYVSFYLTLLIPIFGLLFIRSFLLGKEESIRNKILWAALFALVIFNLIGSSSSGGLMGMAFVVLVAVIMLNKKILKWWKPIAVLLVLTILVAGISYNRWMPELTSAVHGVSGEQAKEDAAVSQQHKIDYMITSENAITIGVNGDAISFHTYPDDPSSLSITDSKGASVSMTELNKENPEFKANDPRFDWMTVKPAQDEQGNHYIVIVTDEKEWPFRISEEGLKYLSGTGKLLNLPKVPAVGWEDNQQFGNGRGYIWSRTIPMMKETLLLGHGADTYCIYFPQYDFVGKYNSGTFSSNPNIIVDKPHNMYFGAIVGTGGISVLALLLLWGIYLVKSFVLYFRRDYTDYLTFVGAGIFLGISGFLLTGFVNDSTVSVMPMFYGLLGTGLAINMMLKQQIQD